MDIMAHKVKMETLIVEAKVEALKKFHEICKGFPGDKDDSVENKNSRLG